MKRLTPHQKIIRAAERGTGLRLTRDEAWYLSMDSAIQTLAANNDDDMADGRSCEQIMNSLMGRDPLPAGFTEDPPC